MSETKTNNKKSLAPKYKIGDKIGKWEIIGESFTRGKWRIRCYQCRCSCGNEKVVSQSNLFYGKSRGCILCRKVSKDPPDEWGGRQYANWTVIKVARKRDRHQSVMLCRCECGLEREIQASALKNGREPRCECQIPYIRVAGVHRLIWKKVLWGAQTRGLAVEVSWEEAYALLQNQGFSCALTGLPLVISKTNAGHTHGETTASLDRIDATRGYVKDNLMWTHKDINRMRMEFDVEKFIKYCRMVVNKADAAT
jgi:hypothetical protein